MPDDPQVVDEVQFTFRLPSILHARIVMEVKKRQVEFRRYSVTDWLREAAREKLDGGYTPLPQTSQDKMRDQQNMAAQSAKGLGLSPADIARMIPGVKVGLSGGLGSADFNVGDAPVEDVVARPWLPELLKIQKTWEGDPGGAQDDYSQLVLGMKLPAEYRGFKAVSQNKELAKRAAWLDLNHPLLPEGK